MRETIINIPLTFNHMLYTISERELNRINNTVNKNKDGMTLILLHIHTTIFHYIDFLKVTCTQSLKISP